MLFKQHENYVASNVVMTTPAVPPPAPVPTPAPQQPKVAPSPQIAQNVAQISNDQVQVMPAIIVPTSRQDEIKPQITNQSTSMSSSPEVVKPKITNAMVAKPKITQTDIKVTKIQPIQVKANNLPKSSPHKSRVVSNKPETIYLPKILVHHAPVKAKAKPKPNKSAYVVQLGAFSNNNNANVLIQHLRTNGFTSFGYKKKRAGNQILTYVYVGPLVTHQHAKQMIHQLQKVMKIKGAIVPFNATKIY